MGFTLGAKIRYTDSMANREEAGYGEIEHTADWELMVWAPDLPGLLVQAARGMYALANTALADEPRVKRAFELDCPDRESLLVDFLAELLFYSEDEGLAFDQITIALEGPHARVRLDGAPISSQEVEIKAVTYHRLAVRQTARGLEVNIVFDV